jgi:hypothetical protein
VFDVDEKALPVARGSAFFVGIAGGDIRMTVPVGSVIVPAQRPWRVPELSDPLVDVMAAGLA